jgi:hypothetical protein
MADTTDKNKTPGNRTRREKQEVLVVGKKCGGRRAVRGEEKKIAGVAIGDEVFFPTSPGVKALAREGEKGKRRISQPPLGVPGAPYICRAGTSGRAPGRPCACCPADGTSLGLAGRGRKTEINWGQRPWLGNTRGWAMGDRCSWTARSILVQWH